MSGVILLALLAYLAFAGETSESSFSVLKKSCQRIKNKSVCGCVAKNLDVKFKAGRISDQQVNDAAEVYKGSRDPRLDYMADLIAGLEFHCLENSNYSGE